MMSSYEKASPRQQTTDLGINREIAENYNQVLYEER